MDRIEKLEEVRERYTEYVARLQTEQLRLKDADLGEFKRVVTPLQIVVDEMNGLAESFTDKFLGKFPTLTVSEDEASMFAEDQEEKKRNDAEKKRMSKAPRKGKGKKKEDTDA